MPPPYKPPEDLAETVRRALREDVGAGDLSAVILPELTASRASVICREQAVLCGRPWFDEVFAQLDTSVHVDWHAQDGEMLTPGFAVCSLAGPARALLTGERTALNFLQLLSGTATVTRRFATLLEGTRATLLDTRKTLPGLRSAQKYAVLCGGGTNHRMGLFDAILLKENHIHAAGGIRAAVRLALATGKHVQVEVESLAELQQAIESGAHRVLLDNFTLPMMSEAVRIAAGRLQLEASGGVDQAGIQAIARTGVDFISVGALTKHVQAVDFSMRFAAPAN